MDFRNQRNLIRLNEMLLNGNIIRESFSDEDSGGDLGGGAGGGGNEAPYVSDAGTPAPDERKKQIVPNTSPKNPIVTLTRADPVRIYSMAGKKGFTQQDITLLLRFLQRLGPNFSYGEYPPGSGKYFIIDRSTVPPTLYGHNTLYPDYDRDGLPRGSYPPNWPIIPFPAGAGNGGGGGMGGDPNDPALPGAPGAPQGPGHGGYPLTIPVERWREIPELQHLFIINPDDYVPGGIYGGPDGRLKLILEHLGLLEFVFGFEAVHIYRIERQSTADSNIHILFGRGLQKNYFKYMTELFRRNGILDYHIWEDLQLFIYSNVHNHGLDYDRIPITIEQIRERIRNRTPQLEAPTPKPVRWWDPRRFWPFGRPN